MKKRKYRKLTAAGIVAGFAVGSAVSLSGCTPEGSNVTVYGPPEVFETPVDPEENQNEDVYGPPEVFEQDNDDVDESADPGDSDDAEDTSAEEDEIINEEDESVPMSNMDLDEEESSGGESVIISDDGGVPLYGPPALDYDD